MAISRTHKTCLAEIESRLATTHLRQRLSQIRWLPTTKLLLDDRGYGNGLILSPWLGDNFQSGRILASSGVAVLASIPFPRFYFSKFSEFHNPRTAGLPTVILTEVQP